MRCPVHPSLPPLLSCLFCAVLPCQPVLVCATPSQPILQSSLGTPAATVMLSTPSNFLAACSHPFCSAPIHPGSQRMKPRPRCRNNDLGHQDGDSLLSTLERAQKRPLRSLPALQAQVRNPRLESTLISQPQRVTLWLPLCDWSCGTQSTLGRANVSIHLRFSNPLLAFVCFKKKILGVFKIGPSLSQSPRRPALP